MPPKRTQKRKSRAQPYTPPLDLKYTGDGHIETPARAGSDPRGHVTGITRDDTIAIASYVDDPSTSMKAKGLPWADIARHSGVDLPRTKHFFPPGKRVITERAIRKRCEEDEGLINTIAEEERELSKEQAIAREDWRVEQ
ncbi:hypothetical protein DL95DRAFT_465798 [Leptodontidium sp. 2 PMI_412]|nr:hypothetical protein DL95DRAFT_465798 [Leptodontidium sp. 2 PMI_412]